MKSLVEILKEQNTDKLANDYGEFYEELFKPIRHTALRILEIGIAQGGSLRAWKEYFTKADIYGLDIEDHFVEAAREFRIRTFKLDAGSWWQLSGWADQTFDVIIDDGSHMSKDIITAFEILWKRLNSRGYYIVEDTRISYRPEYQSTDSPSTMSYFLSRAEDITEDYDKDTILFRSNMIVLQKK